MIQPFVAKGKNIKEGFYHCTGKKKGGLLEWNNIILSTIRELLHWKILN